MNLADPDHYLHVTRTFLGGDGGADHFPALAQTLEKTRALHAKASPEPRTLFELADPPLNTFLAAAKITYCAIQPDGVTAVVGGVITLLDAASAIQASLVIVDHNTNTATTIPIATKTNSYSLSFNVEQVVTSPPDFTATLTVTITPVTGAGAYSLTDVMSCTGTPAVTSMSVTDPVSKMTPPRDFIKIALNRTPQQQADCDYYYTTGMQGPAPVVGLQVTGTASLSPQVTIPAGTSFDGYLYLFKRGSWTGGGACIVIAPGTVITPGVPSDAPVLTLTPTGFQWAFGPDTFQAAPWEQNDSVDFDFFLECTGQATTGGAPVPVRVRVTSIPQYYSSDPPTDVYAVPHLTFVWGCLPAGTMIRTSDGELAVETIDIGRVVVTGDGRELEVTQAWRGWETAPFVRLLAISGEALVLTEGHPVLTARGMVLAREVSAGDELATADGGRLRLSAVERIPSETEVYNLDLGTLEEAGPDGATMIANGIVVGDNRAQAALGRRELERHCAGSGRVAPGWELDVENGRRRALGLPLVATLA